MYPLPIAGESIEDAKLSASLPTVEVCEPTAQDDVEDRCECKESSSCLGGHSGELSKKACAIDDSMQRHYFRECVYTSFFASVREGLDANEAAARAIVEANRALEADAKRTNQRQRKTQKLRKRRPGAEERQSEIEAQEERRYERRRKRQRRKRASNPVRIA